LIGIDLMEPPGKAPLSVVADRDGTIARFDLELAIRERAFPVQVLSLPKKMAEFDAGTLERIRREAQELEVRLAAVSAPAWDLPFLPPVEDYRPAGFGARRVINREPRSPHAGVDLHLPAGTPVRAIAAGAVAFSGEQFFGGRSVVLDHGGGLFSFYYHLQETLEKGERIGAVGSSGRATGPHLHFGVRAAGGRVDPSLLFGPAFH
jgi:murein DD-endopeptidase MepM/ murein hydrolase activator NlpD